MLCERTCFCDTQQEPYCQCCSERIDKGTRDGQDPKDERVDWNGLSGSEPLGEEVGRDFEYDVAVGKSPYL